MTEQKLETMPPETGCQICHKLKHVKYYGNGIWLWLDDECAKLFFPEEVKNAQPAS